MKGKYGKIFLVSLIGVMLLIILTNISTSFDLNFDLKEKEIENKKISNINNIKVANSVLEKLEKQEQVRVIIKLKDGEDGEDDKREDIKKIKKLNKDKIKSLKEEVIEDIGKEKIKHEFEDSISAQISSEDLNRLRDSPEIEKIELVGIKYIFLQDSISLVNASLTWSLQTSGINLTGADETVCIIDTGINYSHPDLANNYIGGWDFCADNVNCNTEDNDPIDVNGHGTHVAGIVSANGNIKGVAPDTKIVMIKAGNSSGAFWNDDLRAAIDWCVDNSSIYNISVISMSLGGGLYSNYCDSEPNELAFVPSINNAVSQNISVIVATGNNGNFTHISSPACIQNATAVGAVNKSDFILYNRNNITDLIAPGTYINSTGGPVPAGCSKTGDYMTCSGTSMSAPHVSGAFAILNQFFKLQNNRSGTPSEIQSALNSTGKQIYDSSSNRNYSRIDIYSAILTLDDTAPSVTLISPENNYLTSNQSITFKCNATDNLKLKNITLQVWNSTFLYNETSQSATGSFAELEVNLTNMPNEGYKWNCLAGDSAGNNAYAGSNFSLIIGQLNVILSSPQNNTFINQPNQNQNFTCNTTSELSSQLTNITFYLWNSSYFLAYNETKNISGFSNSSTFNYSFSIDDNYKWNCLVYNNKTNNTFAESNYTLTYDNIIPNITLISPADGNSSTTSAYNFTFNVTDSSEIANCSLIFDGSFINIIISVSKTSENGMYNSSLGVGSHSWSINCTDQANNQQNSTSRSLTVSSPPVDTPQNDGSSPGGTGTAPTYTTHTLSEQQLSQGTTKTLKEKDKIKFSVKQDNKSEQHSLTLNKIASTYVNITISSTPQQAVLNIGDEKKFDITNNSYYDILVKLKSIDYTNKKANLTIKKIKEDEKPAPKAVLHEENKTKTPGNQTELDISGSAVGEIIKKGYFIIIIVLVVALAVYFVVSNIQNKRLKEELDNVKKERKKERKNEKQKKSTKTKKADKAKIS